MKHGVGRRNGNFAMDRDIHGYSNVLITAQRLINLKILCELIFAETIDQLTMANSVH